MTNVNNRLIVWRPNSTTLSWKRIKRVRKKKEKKKDGKKRKKISLHNPNWGSREKNQSFIEVFYSGLLWWLLLIQMEAGHPGLPGKKIELRGGKIQGHQL